jgi:hypothetical protein
MVLDGRRNDSFWWKDLQTLKVGVGLNMGSWFDDHHFRVMDIGDWRSFYILCERVSRLFSLPIDQRRQNVYVTEICRLFTYLTQSFIFMNMIVFIHRHTCDIHSLNSHT